MTTLGRIVQTKAGVYERGSIRFFDYTRTEPEPGRVNIGYIRDLPSVQLQFIGRGRDEVMSTLEQHRHKISMLQGFVTMTHTLARHIIDLYKLRPDTPYEIFMNYPDRRETPLVKRDEFVYIGAIPVNFKGTLKFLAGLQDRTGMESFFVKRKNYDNNPLTDDCLHVDNYDFGSKYGLLINENEFPQAGECLPRKILVYLMAGIYPVFHESFTESIQYCQNNGVAPIVYRDLDDLARIIKAGPARSNIARSDFCMEHREAELIRRLDALAGRGIAPMTRNVAVNRSNVRRPVTNQSRIIKRRR